MSIDLSGGVRCVAPAGDVCGEGVLWAGSENAVYWTDINRFLAHRLDLATGNARSWFFDEPVVALAPTDRSGRLLVALASRLVLWDPATDARLDHGFCLADAPRVRLNDGRADPRGDFWVGSMRNNVEADGSPGQVGRGEGKLFRVGRDGFTVLLDGLGVPNTLCWSPDRTRFYLADTIENAIRVFDYDAATGSIRGGRPFFQGFGRGLPDGSAIDADGYLWNCRYGGGCVVRVAPDGNVDRVVEIPAENVTTCTFGGPDLETLYVTTGRSSDRFHRLAGSLFALSTGVRGSPDCVVIL